MAGEDSMGGQTRQTRRVLYGGLIILALFAGALLIFFMDTLLSAFDSEFEIHIVSIGGAGIIPDAPVWVGGREVGSVRSIGFLPSSGDSTARVVITAVLPTSVQAQVRRDSDMRITSVSFISERAVDILPGSPSAPMLEDGDTLRPAPQLSPAQLTQRAAIVRLQLDSALAELRAHAPAVRERMQQTRLAFAGLDGLVSEARAIQAGVNANPGLALLRDPAFGASLRRTQQHAAELPLMIGRLRGTTGAAADVRLALSRLQVRADSLNARLTAAMTALDNPNGTLARMQQDTAITRALNAARAELDSLIADVRSNPLRYVF